MDKKTTKEEKPFKFFNFPKNIKREGIDYSRIVETNEEGLSPEGRQKLIDFFLSQPESYRKIISFIWMRQKLTGKHAKITLDAISKFSGIKDPKELKHALYYLYRRVCLLKGQDQEYRVPRFLWDTDILDNIKKIQISQR